MVDLGVRLEDTPGGSIWELVDANTLKKLRDDKLREAREAKLHALQLKKEKKAKDLERYKAALEDPKDFFMRLKNTYGAFDSRGVPTHDAEGKELSKNARKDAEKKMKKAEEEHEKFKRKLASDPNEIDRLAAEVTDLQKQIEEL